jgi:hypothetical protein
MGFLEALGADAQFAVARRCTHCALPPHLDIIRQHIAFSVGLNIL